MPSRIRVVYISANAHRSERDGRLRGDRNRPAVMKFYGKAALRAAEEDAISNWGAGGVVNEIIGAATYKRAPIWSKFHRIQRGGILLGRCWIGRESRRLRAKESGFVRFLTLQGYDRRPKKVQPVQRDGNRYRIAFEQQAGGIPYGMAQGEIPMPTAAATPANLAAPRIGIWG